MAEFYLSIAIGTTATLVAIILVLLRTEFHGHGLIGALTRWWIAMDRHSSGIVVVLLCVIAVSSFAGIGDKESSNSLGTTTAGGPGPLHVQTEASNLDQDLDSNQALDALRTYTNQIEAEPKSTASQSSAANSIALPDVDTMIAKLIARLEMQPNDVKGWKMLGWSYLNTDRSEEAVRAYESALKLEPGDIEIKKSLETAKSARMAAARASSSKPTSEPANDDVKLAESPSDSQRRAMNPRHG